MPQITENGGLANAIGVKDSWKIWVFEGVSANCPPIKAERGDNSLLRRKKESLRTATRKRKKWERRVRTRGLQERAEPLQAVPPGTEFRERIVR